MSRLLALLLHRRAEVLTIILLLLGLALTVTADTPQRVKWLSSSSKMAGSVFQLRKNISDYFELGTLNNELAIENQKLREALYQAQFEKALLGGDFRSADTLKAYRVIDAKVIKNSVIREKNLITLNKGTVSGLEKDMGVISDKGVIGVVERSSAHFSTVVSLLHKELSINASLKNTNHFGSLIWEGAAIDRCTLVDLPKIAKIEIGDTIVTGGMSSVFPPGIPIGQISNFTSPKNSSFYKVEVRLFNDMSDLDQVYIIASNLKQEQLQLERTQDEFR